MATVRRSSAEFQYQLVITRVYEEGEEALLDEDDESKPSLVLNRFYGHLILYNSRRGKNIPP